MAGLDPMHLMAPGRTQGKKREEVVKSSWINVEVTQRMGKKRGSHRAPVNDQVSGQVNTVFDTAKCQIIYLPELMSPKGQVCGLHCWS